MLEILYCDPATEEDSSKVQSNFYNSVQTFSMESAPAVHFSQLMKFK